MTIDANTVMSWRGRDVVSRDGEKVGSIAEIYLDEQTEKPEWALLRSGLFGGKSTFVPLAGAQEADEAVQVPFDKAHIEQAPKAEADGQLSQQEEAALYGHYGMDYSESRSGSGLPEGGPPQGTGEPGTDQAMTRSEEELRVGTTRREAGRARLRKHVVTEEVQANVPVQREELRVEREPITDANVDQATDGPAISEEEHEVVLQQEEPVVEKRAVPKERVRLDKEVVTEEEQVSGEVRKEQIDIDADPRP